jgi:hypothetical protein
MSYEQPGKESYCIPAKDPDKFYEFEPESDITRRPERVAAEAGEHYYCQDGVTKNDFPVVIRLRDGYGGTVGDYRVGLEFSPEFYADKVAANP